MRLIGLWIALFSANLWASSLENRLVAEHHSIISKAENREYEKLATRRFWSDTSFMGICASVNVETPPFRIVYVIEDAGELDEIHLFPETNAGKCIREYASKIVFPAPPSRFVGVINMNFTQ